MLSLQLHLPFAGRAENRRACVIKSRNKKRKANTGTKAKVKETKKVVAKMAPKKSTIVLNVEQFIHDIEERPAIWNRNFHCNKAFLEQMWDELSGTHKLPSKYGPLFPHQPPLAPWSL